MENNKSFDLTDAAAIGLQLDLFCLEKHSTNYLYIFRKSEKEQGND